MDYKNILKSLVLTTSLLLTPSYAEKPNKPLEKKVTKFVKQEKQEKSEPYKAIESVLIKDFLKDYLNKITPKSNNFKKLRKKYGREGVLERYCSAHELCLDLAFKYENKIPFKEYEKLGEQLAKKQHNTSKDISRVEYLDKGVIDAFEKWGKLKTDNFDKLLEAGHKTDPNNRNYIKKLHNKAYSRKEYGNYVKKQNQANDELYDSMKDTLNFIEALIGGGEIKRIAKTTREVYKEPLKKYFENDNKKK